MYHGQEEDEVGSRKIGNVDWSEERQWRADGKPGLEVNKAGGEGNQL